MGGKRRLPLLLLLFVLADASVLSWLSPDAWYSYLYPPPEPEPEPVSVWSPESYYAAARWVLLTDQRVLLAGRCAHIVVGIGEGSEPRGLPLCAPGTSSTAGPGARGARTG